MAPVTFIYTNSLDLTVDLLISRLGSDQVFRFNIDLWRDYQIRIDHEGLFVANLTGRSVRQSDIAKFYWRRPHITARLYPERTIDQETNYMEQELFYAFRDSLNLIWSAGKVVLTEPMADSRIGKLVQLAIARKYFQVPDYKFVAGSPNFLQGSNGDVVVKSLTSERVTKHQILYTTRVVEQELDPYTPWFVQQYQPASHDITIVFVKGDLYAFELPRAKFIEQTPDWREVDPVISVDGWKPHCLPPEMQAAVRAFMEDLGLHYGRLDLLLDGESYAFLEVNPNGEWAWLDFDGNYGLLDRMVYELAPGTPCQPIPIKRQFVV